MTTTDIIFLNPGYNDIVLLNNEDYTQTFGVNLKNLPVQLVNIFFDGGDVIKYINFFYKLNLDTMCLVKLNAAQLIFKRRKSKAHHRMSVIEDEV